MLDQNLLFETLNQGLWTAVIISAPILGVALVVGLVVGLFQALTSIQELTLTSTPKLGAIIITFWLSLDLMSQTLVTFFTDSVLPLISGSGA